MSAKFVHLSITCLKDSATIQTAERVINYVKNPGLNNTGKPDGQDDVDVQRHGLSMVRDQEIDIDVRENQLPYFQAAIDAGDIEVSGMPTGIVAAKKDTKAESKAAESKAAEARADMSRDRDRDRDRDKDKGK